MNQRARVLYCDCSHAEVVPPQVKRAVLERLSAAGVAFDAVADLCELSARGDPAMKRIAESGNLRIAACYPRAVRWLFHAAGAPLASERAEVLNMRELSAAEVVAGLLSQSRCGDGPASSQQPGQSPAATSSDKNRPVFQRSAQPGAWIPWFPVIDYDRCTNCQQCLSFCLFGVFDLDADGQVEVRNPDHCKTGCPACARVCPSVAIMFPKHDQGPINGDVVRDEDIRRKPVKVDVAALLGQDVHSSLRARSRRAKDRFSAAPDPSERERYLKQMQTELGIPDEVMRDLCAADSCGQPPADAATKQCQCQTCSRTGKKQQPRPS